MITEFRGQHAFLSNFYPVPVLLDGLEYPTVEHAYQASKFLEKGMRANIRRVATPAQAKRLGRLPGMMPGFDKIKETVMKDLLRQKFAPVTRKYVAPLHELLLATGNEVLIEGNSWGDQYWGKTLDWSGKWVGQNRLGLLLMDVRRELLISAHYLPLT